MKYSKFIEKFVKGHLDNAEIETDNLAAPFYLIKLFLLLNNMEKLKYKNIL
jgi:hypothetical protein